jgi:hypothetical protein
MSRQQGMILKTALVVVAVYFLIVPAVWRMVPPSATANLPEEWPHDEDIPLNIRISSIHPNYKVTQVRLYIDHTQTTLKEPGDPLAPIILLDVQKPRKWSPLTLNRLTFPRRKKLSLVVPLADLAEKNFVRAGTLVGTLDVIISSAGSTSSGNRGITGPTPYMVIQQIPFVLELH